MLRVLCAECAVDMPFEEDTNVLTHRTLIALRQQNQIIIQGFRDMQLHIAITFDRAGSARSRRSRGNGSGTQHRR